MQTRKVRKAVIPAAGRGTRFMPITKSVPKEMLVLVDKPAIHYIVEECAESGIEEVAIIVSRGKEAIERYFTPTLNDTPELKALLKKIKITFITQETLNGTGGAILLTKDFVGDEPFAVLFGDDVVVNDVPCIKQLIDAYDKTGKTVVGVQEVENELAVLYGAIEKGESHGRFTEFKNLIEKPDINNLPSNLVSLGRFVLSNGIFGALEQTPMRGTELVLPEAVSTIAKTEGAVAYTFEGAHYDIGNKLGYVIAAADFSLARFGDDFKKHIKTIL